MTVGMGVVESNDKVVLAITCSAVTFIAACNFHIHLLDATLHEDNSFAIAFVGSALVVVGVSSGLWLLRSLTKQIEAMEVTATR